MVLLISCRAPRAAAEWIRGPACEPFPSVSSFTPFVRRAGFLEILALASRALATSRDTGVRGAACLARSSSRSSTRFHLVSSVFVIVTSPFGKGMVCYRQAVRPHRSRHRVSVATATTPTAQAGKRLPRDRPARDSFTTTTRSISVSALLGLLRALAIVHSRGGAGRGRHHRPWAGRLLAAIGVNGLADHPPGPRLGRRPEHLAGHRADVPGDFGEPRPHAECQGAKRRVVRPGRVSVCRPGERRAIAELVAPVAADVRVPYYLVLAVFSCTRWR